MTTATETPARTLLGEDAARAEVREATAAKDAAAAAAKAAVEASKADPDNEQLADDVRQARNAQRRAARALKKAEETLAELAEVVEAPAADTALSPLDAAPAELRQADAAKEAAATATRAADKAAEADPDNAALFAAARKARWDELKATKAAQKAAAALAEAEDAAGVVAEEPGAEAPQSDPVAVDAVVIESTGDPVKDAELQAEAAARATAAAEAAADADPDDKALGAAARRARAAEKKAARALKKARAAADEAVDEVDATADATVEVAEAPVTEVATSLPVAPAATNFQDTLALVSSGASVLAVAADTAERAAATDPANVLLAEAARAARAAAQQAAQAVAAAAAVYGSAPAVPTASATPTPDAATEPATEPEAAASDEPTETPEIPEDPTVVAARAALAEAEKTQEDLAAATRKADKAAEADPGNSDLFSAARKARWDELKASKAVTKAAAALEQAIADAPPAPKVLTEEEKDDRRAPKPQGQWLVDGDRPLNDDERIKQEDAGLAVADRVRNIYAKEGFDSIPAEDLAPRFKWIGMYTQRRQDMGGEQTGVLTNAELQDRYFMMRVRLDGGFMSSEQMRVIGGISRDFARNTADFTDRQNIQLHWIRIEDVPEIWDRLASVNLDTFFGCGDVPRVILGSPVAGISKDEIIDATPAIREIKDNWLTRDEFANLPRKFKTAISGNSRQDVTHEIQDIAFIGSEHPEKGAGFDVWVGGGLSTNPMFAQRLGVWVSIDEVPEVWAGAVRIFRDYGYRKLRNRARLKFLVADWGVEKFRRILEDDYLGHRLTDGPAPEAHPGYRDHVGVHEQRDGKFYVGVKPTVGHTEGDQLIRLADIAEAHGVTRLRTSADKELIFLDVAADATADLAAALEVEGLSATPSSFRRDIISCTGLEFCKLALVTTKQRAITLADQLEERLGDLDVPLKISLNGCPNSCARTQVADIGLKGQIVTDDDGNRVEGFQVHLGGALGMHPDFGKKLRGHKVTSAELDDYIVRVVEHYKDQRADGEQFRDWVLRADEEVLQ
ncbi:nitrite/sulfite reductase [Corynebacterium terpenotabidum]|uniref:assimilatory sulfite reductase (ferredoxin) n=1 Tax=Corynebacterium terpenotabidum Y-11 TaxID=1200352 RepID=S4XBP3_9CORY|nr:nitrite/sulfite reductase [Corynebacterium terpenotabidum]AGP29996.1 sulfite reductase [Corynebacterium terpenotabidum Y-11]